MKTKTTSKHTPGPWKHEPTTQSRYAYIVLTEDFDEDANQGTVLCRLSDGLSEADARLIAAAPDLLAACKEAIYLAAYGVGAVCPLDALPHQTENSDRCIREARGIQDMLRAAIAKAEGGDA